MKILWSALLHSATINKVPIYIAQKRYQKCKWR